jgi:hypothetical protein
MVLALIAAASLASPGTIMPARASAQASVRIVAGARVHLGPSADASEARLIKASVRTEDGQRRPAILVEFQ